MSQQTIRGCLRDLELIAIGVHGLDDGEKFASDAHTAILKLIKEMVPEEKDGAGDREQGAEFDGWNSCRQTFLDRLEEMDKQT